MPAYYTIKSTVSELKSLVAKIEAEQKRQDVIWGTRSDDSVVVEVVTYERTSEGRSGTEVNIRLDGSTICGLKE